MMRDGLRFLLQCRQAFRNPFVSTRCNRARKIRYYHCHYTRHREGIASFADFTGIPHFFAEPGRPRGAPVPYTGITSRASRYGTGAPRGRPGSLLHHHEPHPDFAEKGSLWYFLPVLLRYVNAVAIIRACGKLVLDTGRSLFVTQNRAIAKEGQKTDGS